MLWAWAITFSHEDALRQVSLTAFSSPTVQSIGFAIRKVGWDTRLFNLESRAMGVGNYVCVEDSPAPDQPGASELVSVSINVCGSLGSWAHVA